jgi:hypothetical protein
MQHQIIVRVDTAGKVEVEVNGVTGSSCEALTQALEESLGTAKDREQKGEFHANEQAGQNLGQA